MIQLSPRTGQRIGELFNGAKYFSEFYVDQKSAHNLSTLKDVIDKEMKSDSTAPIVIIMNVHGFQDTGNFIDTNSFPQFGDVVITAEMMAEGQQCLKTIFFFFGI